MAMTVQEAFQALGFIGRVGTFFSGGSFINYESEKMPFTVFFNIERSPCHGETLEHFAKYVDNPKTGKGGSIQLTADFGDMTRMTGDDLALLLAALKERFPEADIRIQGRAWRSATFPVPGLR